MAGVACSTTVDALDCETNLLVVERLRFVPRFRERALVDDRAVRALRRDATDGLQVAGAPSRGRPRAAWPTGAGRRIACPHRTSDATEALIVEARQHVRLGGQEAPAGPPRRGIRRGRGRPAAPLNDVLERHDLLRKNRRRRTWTHPGAAPGADRPPESGVARRLQRAVQDGRWPYCYPLTVTDHFSRALLVCRGLASVKTALTQPVFRALFREVGLPDAIRTDNGAPFASTGIHGLSPLNVWWMQLGIVHQRIHARPVPKKTASTNAMHRELKRETTHPAGAQPARAAMSLRGVSPALQRRAAARGASAIARPPRSGRPRRASIPSASRRRSIPRTWKSVASAARARSGSTRSNPS